MSTKDEHKHGNGHNARVKFRMVDFEMEGGNAELAEGLKSFATSIARGNFSNSQVRVLTASKTATTNSATATGEAVDTAEAENGSSEVDENFVDLATEDTAEDTDRPKRKYIPPMPRVVTDLDIKTGDMPLKKFLEQKGPSKAQDRIVAVSAWLRKYQNVEEVSRDHLYTCYQQLGGSGEWKSPNDFDSMIRTISKRKGWFEKGSAENLFKLTIVGLNHVDDMGASIN